MIKKSPGGTAREEDLMKENSDDFEPVGRCDITGRQDRQEPLAAILSFGSPAAFTLSGGYTADYLSNLSCMPVTGSLTISAGHSHHRKCDPSLTSYHRREYLITGSLNGKSDRNGRTRLLRY